MFDFDEVCRQAEKLDPVTYAAIITEKSQSVVAGIQAVTGDAELTKTLFTMLLLGAVIFAESRKALRDAEGHRGVVSPVARRGFEDIARHHLRDPRVVILPHELNGRTEAVSYYKPPEKAEGLFPC